MPEPNIEIDIDTQLMQAVEQFTVAADNLRLTLKRIMGKSKYFDNVDSLPLSDLLKFAFDVIAIRGAK